MEIQSDTELRMIEERIISPCLEIIESTAREKDTKAGEKDYTGYLLQEKIKLTKRIRDCREMVVPRFSLVLGTKCTLKCKDCANLMQYYDKSSDLDIENILNDLKQLFSMVDVCTCVSVIGGEPMIYPDLDRVLEWLIDNKKVEKIEITTNGTVIPSDKLLNIMADSKIKVIISDYGRISLMAELVTALDQFGVLSECYPDEKWIDLGGVEPRKRKKEDLVKLYQACRSGKMCKTLFKGKLYDCPRAAHLMDLGYADQIEYLDIYHCSKEELLSFYIKNISYACDYCDLMAENKKYIEPAKQMNGRDFKRSSHTLILRKNYENVLEAKQYWERQFCNSEKMVKELREWIGELEASKEYFLKRIEELEKKHRKKIFRK